jgi:hypothetical protein
MVLASWLESVPLLIDHDEGRRIGTVESLDEFEDTDGRWITARWELYPDAPEWIRRGTGASWAYKAARRSSYVEGYVYGAFVTEVTLVQEQVPLEPRARVALLYEPEPPARPLPTHAPTPRARNRRTRGQAEIAELHRRIAAAGHDADVEAILVSMKLEQTGRWRLAV